MSSQSRTTRENQKALCDHRLQARKDVLEKRGMAPPDFKKDKVYQHLTARHQAIVNAIAAIDASLARPKQVEAKTASKAAAAPPPAEKKQKKEKPEKSDKPAKAPPAGPDKQ